MLTKTPYLDNNQRSNFKKLGRSAVSPLQWPSVVAALHAHFQADTTQPLLRESKPCDFWHFLELIRQWNYQHLLHGNNSIDQLVSILFFKNHILKSTSTIQVFFFRGTFGDFSKQQNCQPSLIFTPYCKASVTNTISAMTWHVYNSTASVSRPCSVTKPCEREVQEAHTVLSTYVVFFSITKFRCKLISPFNRKESWRAKAN